MTTKLLAALGAATLAYNAVAFGAGVVAGVKTSMAKRRARIEAGDELRRRREAASRGA